MYASRTKKIAVLFMKCFLSGYIIKTNRINIGIIHIPADAVWIISISGMMKHLLVVISLMISEANYRK
ncbi:hypothetical protein A0U40_16670 [[Bacillus] sp. KCTC 13219]|nr:hypothetical protein A0U40_16670 [[Bacillus] sp. KCTC 13219]